MVLILSHSQGRSHPQAKMSIESPKGHYIVTSPSVIFGTLNYVWRRDAPKSSLENLSEIARSASYLVLSSSHLYAVLRL